MPHNRSAVDILVERARGFALDLDAGAAATMLRHLAAVLAENRRVNLTSVTDPDAALERHVLDSLAFGLHLADAGSRALPAHPLLVDLGTGAGFPGVPAALALPHAHVHLVEGRGRKAAALARILPDLRVPGATVHHARLADLVRAGLFAGRAADLVLARAVAPLARLVSEAAPALAPGGTLLCWKSARFPDAERRAGERAARRAGLVPLPDVTYVSDRPSRLVRLSKEGP